MNPKLSTFVSALLLTTLATAAQASTPMGLIAAGKPFPDLVLPAAEDGRPLSLADFRGQKVILHVFASW